MTTLDTPFAPTNAHPVDPAVAPLAELSAYWTQRQAAAALHVSPRYLRASSCPKLLLPGTGKAGRPLVRYEPAVVRAWAEAHRSDRRSS